MKPKYNSRNQTAHLDSTALFLYILIVFVGFLNIYSATAGVKSGFLFDFSKEYGKQIIWIGGAVIIAILVIFSNPNFFEYSAYIIYGITILLLLAVLIFGREVSGAKSWFGFMGIGIQPSEFAKYGTAIAIAKFLGSYNVSLKGWKNYSIVMALFLIPMALILKQNDTGSALVFLCFFLVLYREGFPGYWLLLGVYLIALSLTSIAKVEWYLLGAVILACAFIVYKNRNRLRVILMTSGFVVASIIFTFGVQQTFKQLKNYQQERVLATLGMKELFNTKQSKVAIGSGQLLGMGYRQGIQTKTGWVPEQHTDFIFCTIGEEWGFIGVLAFFALYVGFLFRLIIMAERQVTIFGRVFGYSFISILFFHFTVNIGTTLGIVPVIGIPLPFVSFGGSSLWAFSLMFFTFLKIDEARIRYS